MNYFCPLCKANNLKSYNRRLWCINCKRFRNNSFFNDINIKDNDGKLISGFVLYFDEDDNICEFFMQLPNDLAVNACWGTHPPENVILIKHFDSTILYLNANIEYKPDVEYLYNKVKLYLAFQ